MSEDSPKAAVEVPAGLPGRPLGAPLTAKQQRIWELTREGKTHAWVAQELGISVPVVSKTVSRCRKKLGLTKKGAGISPDKDTTLAIRNPDEFAARLDAATEPDKLGPVKQALIDAGVSGKAAEAYVARLKRRYPGVLAAGRALKTSELVEKLDQKINMVLDAMDEHVILEASFRDLALGGTAMIEKRQLLKGQPTAITSDLERKKLIELTPLLLVEAKRRGLTIEGTAERVVEGLPA